VASLGQLGSALFLDTASLETEQLALPPTFGLAVLHSGVEHHLDRDAYGLRRRECEAAARALGVHALGALTLEDLPRTAALGSPLDHRARHVLPRTPGLRPAALRAATCPDWGADASHRSLRDDFQVSTPEVDTLVDLARNVPGILGARMTGGGFGGAIIALGPPAGLRQAMEAVASDYRRLVGRPGRVLLPE
jgi:galactokinase